MYGAISRVPCQNLLNSIVESHLLALRAVGHVGRYKGIDERPTGGDELLKLIDEIPRLSLVLCTRVMSD